MMKRVFWTFIGSLAVVVEQDNLEIKQKTDNLSVVKFTQRVKVIDMKTVPPYPLDKENTDENKDKSN